MARCACLGLVAAAVLALTGSGPLRAEAPLSAIDWLSKQAAERQRDAEQYGAATGLPIEAPIAESITRPQITVAPLASEGIAVGLVPAAVTGLPERLWQGDDPDAAASRIMGTRADLPAMRALLMALLLTDAAHSGPEDVTVIARIDRLLKLGAAEPALALAEQAGAHGSPALFARAFDAALILGQEDERCEAMQQNPALAPDAAARLFCLARAGDLSAATIIFDSASALSLYAPQMLGALERFLHPEADDEAEALPTPPHPDPLLFRLHEAIGEPLSTSALPLVFANSDLRGLAGWKAELNAAERLTRAGVLAPNLLLGTYTNRLPSASGGVWDRVEALQRFETALKARDPDAVSRTLAPVWEAMKAAGLEVSFAELFADPLSRVALPRDQDRALAFEVALLSPQYEAARLPANAGARAAFLAQLAAGTPDAQAAPGPRAAAVAEAFAERPVLPQGVAPEPVGTAVLKLMSLIGRGARGALPDMRAGLEGLRALGLEDTARRTALQWLILGDQ